jgi:hypothetical protein
MASDKSSVSPGETYTYTITVSSQVAGDVTINARVPGQTTVVSGCGTKSMGSTDCQWTYSVVPGETVEPTFTVRVNATATGRIQEYATASWNSEVFSSNVVYVSVQPSTSAAAGAAG